MTAFVAGQRVTAAALSTTFPMELIQSYVLNGFAVTVDFTGIPQTFVHLRLVYSALCDGSNVQGWEAMHIQLNGLAGTSYNWNTIYATQGGAAASVSNTSDFVGECGSVWNNAFATQGRGVGIIDIPNYTSSTSLKSYTAIGTATDGGTAGTMQSWAGSLNTASGAITSLSLSFAAANFSSDSVISLYGMG